MSAPDGFNIFGHFSTSTGLGAAARNTASLLHSHDIPFVVYDCPIAGYELGRPHGFEDWQRRLRGAMPYGVNLFHVQPHFLGEMLDRDWSFLPMDRRVNSIVPFWELSRFPEGWRRPMNAIDVVLAPSLHIKGLTERAIPSLPVVHYPQMLSLPESVAPDRSLWGFKPDETVFLLSFDVTSDISRKNPDAALAAFQTAFPSDQDVRLVVRMKSADADDRFATFTGRIRDAARNDSRVEVLTSPLPYSDVLSLMASADVYVSLHRAEGLGLPLMESMALGKPVIATAWSGNMDFMTAENSALVGYELLPAAGLHDMYREEFIGGLAKWAEPDASEAAAWMRRLAREPGLAARIGARAREDIAALGESGRSLAALKSLLGKTPRNFARHREVRRFVWASRRAAVARRLRGSR